MYSVVLITMLCVLCESIVYYIVYKVADPMNLEAARVKFIDFISKIYLVKLN